MKKIVLALAVLFAFSAVTTAQNCPIITNATIVPVGPDSYLFSVTYTGNGNKHINVSFYCGTPIPANLISTSCIATSGSSFSSQIFTCAGQNPVAVLTPATGNCGGGTTCAPIQINVGGGPLPLRMTSFFIKRADKKVFLNWKTENEENVKEFQVERLINNAYVVVMNIPASNNPNGSTYAFTDENMSKTTSLYRLKVVEMNGKYAYSDIRSVKGLGISSDFSVYPNPSAGNAKVNVTDISESTDLQLVDQMGRVIKVIDMSNKNSVELNDLQKGMYMIRLINKSTGESNVRKLSVL